MSSIYQILNWSFFLVAEACWFKKNCNSFGIYIYRIGICRNRGWVIEVRIERQFVILRSIFHKKETGNYTETRVTIETYHEYLANFAHGSKFYGECCSTERFHLFGCVEAKRKTTMRSLLALEGRNAKVRKKEKKKERKSRASRIARGKWND